ncbi:MAG: GAF domain-containing protein [Pyrinomonadaceae bacterium]
MPESDETGLPQKLRRLIETIDIASLLTEPLARSIEDLLRISAAELNSGEASVLVREGSNGDLRFLAAIGQVAGKLLNMKIPAGKGIAGFVLSSGQPMAVADVGETETFYAEVDKSTGYSTQMILATPLRHNDDVIGVLEYVNRSGDPPFSAFTPEEMDKAAVFADVIGSLVNAYESAKLFRDLSDHVLNEDPEIDIASLRLWLNGVRAAPLHRDMMDIAILVREIAGKGEPERRLCRELLESVSRFAESKNDTSFLSF